MRGVLVDKRPIQDQQKRYGCLVDPAVRQTHRLRSSSTFGRVFPLETLRVRACVLVLYRRIVTIATHPSLPTSSQTLE